MWLKIVFFFCKLLFFFKLVSEHRKQSDFFPNTMLCLGDISVSTWIWIYLTYSTLAGSRPRQCIFRTHFLQLKCCVCFCVCGHNWIQPDTLEAMFTSLLTCTFYPPFQPQGSSCLYEQCLVSQIEAF